MTAWATPPTFTDGNAASAADLNTLGNDLLNLYRRGAVRVSRSTDQSIPNNTLTAIAFDTETFDTPDNDLHSTTSTTERITVPAGKAGLWLVGAHVQFAANATGYRHINLRINGTTTIAQVTIPAVATAAIQTTLAVSTLYSFAGTDYVECLVQQNSGGALAASSASPPPLFWAVCVHG